MTVRLEGTTKRWIGLSTDHKPQSAGGFGKAHDEIPPGSSFLEADTGVVYRWTGKSWEAPLTEGAQVSMLLLDISDRLGRVTEMLEAALSN